MQPTISFNRPSNTGHYQSDHIVCLQSPPNGYAMEVFITNVTRINFRPRIFTILTCPKRKSFSCREGIYVFPLPSGCVGVDADISSGNV